MHKTLPYVLATFIVGAATATAAPPELTTEDHKAFYALGLALSENLGSFALSPAELEMVKAGLDDGVLHKERKVDLGQYLPKLKALQQARLSAAATVEMKASEAFLVKAAAEKGANKTASGLIITTLKPGAGATPKASDQVTVHYHGTLIDGTVFDSSVQRGQPATFPLDRVIPCWTEGLQLMKVGGKSRLVCPPSLAYGDRGSPPRIKPGATLVFEVELVAIGK
jgi:FKBP-type peptidyl-prolyl cis-trans isomerase FkpA/FKBP-type peptidyl-prolyl cis-trans isomerase FklB